LEFLPPLGFFWHRLFFRDRFPIDVDRDDRSCVAVSIPAIWLSRDSCCFVVCSFARFNALVIGGVIGLRSVILETSFEGDDPLNRCFFRRGDRVVDVEAANDAVDLLVLILVFSFSCFFVLCTVPASVVGR
jgi:hypothetical protein